MVTLVILLFGCMILGCFLHKKRTKPPIFIIALCYFLCAIILVNFAYAAILPYGISNPTVIVVTEDGITEKTRDYFQDKDGNFYVKDWDEVKDLFVPFYRPDFVKTELPDNAYVLKE